MNTKIEQVIAEYLDRSITAEFLSSAQRAAETAAIVPVLEAKVSSLTFENTTLQSALEASQGRNAQYQEIHAAEKSRIAELMQAQLPPKGAEPYRLLSALG